MNVNDLIDSIKKGDVANSNNRFNSVMADKMNAALDVHKQEIAGSVFGTVDVEPEQVTEPNAEEV